MSADSVVSFRCPFCKKACLAGDIKIKGEKEPLPSVLHTQPMCKTFEEMDPLEFLEKVNDATIGAEVMAELRSRWSGKVGHA